MQIIETHCHLDYLDKHPLEEILRMSKEAGVEKILTIAVEPENFNAVFDLANNHDEIYFTQGVHPHDAIKATEECYEVIKSRSTHDKMLAVGEIGLDFHYNHSPKDVQIKVFKDQMQLAIDLDKPIVVHSRDADEDMMKLIKEYAPKINRKGVIHSFTSGEELAKCALENDFYIGINGIITFKNAQNVRDIVSLCPIEKMLIETDAPFLTPVPHRGQENNPSNLPHIINKIAEIKNLDPEFVAAETYKNAITLFRF